MVSTPRAIGNYILDSELGRGATSQVWRGRHRYLKERAVAVKILLSQDEDSTMRFSREAELTAQLRHPNIVAIYDHGMAGNFMYTIMELVPAGSLRQHMQRAERIPLKQAFNIFRQIGGALDFAHAQGIVHRDVSPGNILLESVNGRALLTDFGIARLPQQSHTTSHVIMGTPGFFSPEHAQSATAVTPLSDLYSLGVILYFMLTGELPWAEQPAHPEYHFGPILSLGMRGVDLPTEIDTIFQTLLAVDPKKRYPTAGAATEAIDRALQRAGIVLDRATMPRATNATVRAINTAPSYQSVGVLESEVERILGPDLVREPIEKAHGRAEELRDPLFLARLLDTWSREGRWWEFRRPHLGRIVNLRTVASRNIYFYQVDVLLETRNPATTIEEPDTEAQSFKVRREQDRWTMQLPKPTAFADDEGRTEIIPGSERVIQCGRCGGEGHALCGECKGSRRVLRTVAVSTQDPAEVAIHNQDTINRIQHGGPQEPAQVKPMVMRQTLVPCPKCDGAGSLPCDQCEGTGRLVQRKVFSWSRKAYHNTAHDDLPNLNEAALREQVELTSVYTERATALKREWSEVKALQQILTRIEQELDPNTKVALAEVQVQMIPFTEVEFDLGHSDLVIDQEEAPRSGNDTTHRIQIYGFDNQLNMPTVAYDNERRVLLWVLFLLLLIVLIYTGYIFLLG